MQQTLLAFLSMLALSIIGFSQQRSIYHLHRAAYVREYEMIVADYATGQLGRLHGLAFDEHQGAAAAWTPGPLTAPDRLGPEPPEIPGDPSTYDDLDDYHGYTSTTVHRLGAQADSYDLVVHYTVRYVDPADLEPASPVATSAKEVALTAQAVDARGRTVAQVTLRRLFTVTDAL